MRGFIDAKRSILIPFPSGIHTKMKKLHMLTRKNHERKFFEPSTRFHPEKGPHHLFIFSFPYTWAERSGKEERIKIYLYFSSTFFFWRRPESMIIKLFVFFPFFTLICLSTSSCVSVYLYKIWVDWMTLYVSRISLWLSAFMLHRGESIRHKPSRRGLRLISPHSHAADGFFLPCLLDLI